MPIGLVAPQPLDAGTTPMPVVSPVQPAVNPDAVSQLVDAYRKGAVTSQDIIDHIGMEAQARKRSVLEQMGEYVSPEAINARMSALTAQGAQNNLVTSQAQAAQGLVAPQTNLQQQQIGTQTAATVQGPQGLQAVQSYGPWFGTSMEDFRNPDGSYDFMKASKTGNQMAAQMNIANMWIDRLTPTAQRTYKDASGAEHTAQVNKFGIDVTPPQPERGYGGSPAYHAYVDELQQYLPKGHPARGQFMMNQSSDEAQGAPPPEAGAAQEIQDAGPRGMILPQSATPPPELPMISPATAPGITTTEAKGAYQTPDEIRKSMVAEPAIKTLQEQSKYANNFRTIANNMEQVGATTPGKSVPPQNANDLGLVEGLIKLYDPQATIREFKWDKIENDQPRLEQLRNWTQTVLKSGSLTPQARQRLINMGDEVVGAMENTARDRLQMAQTTATNSAKLAGQDPNSWVNQTLTGDEQRILRGEPFRTPQAPAAATTTPAAPAANSGVVVLKTGPYAGWLYNPATGTVSKQ